MKNKTEIRVRYSETDQMGVVHNANYFIWLEIGRGELLREMGVVYAELEKEGYKMVVSEANCRFHTPSFYDDLVSVHSSVAEVKSRAIKIDAEIKRSSTGELLARGFTRLICLKNGKVAPLPKLVKDVVVSTQGELF